jgi:hypothetical protein
MNLLIKLKLTAFLMSINTLHAAGFDEDLFAMDVKELKSSISSSNYDISYEYYEATAFVSMTDSFGNIRTYARIRQTIPYPDVKVGRFDGLLEANAIVSSITDSKGKIQEYALLKDTKSMPKKIALSDYAYVAEVASCMIKRKDDGCPYNRCPSSSYKDVGDWNQHYYTLADITRTEFKGETWNDGIARQPVKEPEDEELQRLIARPKYVRISRTAAK